MTFPQFPPGNPFPEGQRDTIRDGAPDFPESAGDREKGKFRPSRTPKLTQVAVVDDDGEPIGTALFPSFEQLILEIRKLRLALMRTGYAADIDGDTFDDIS